MNSRMKNGVPQGSVLSPMPFNIYISDLPETKSRKYGYADDLAILLRRPSWKEMEEGLNKDMTILVDYLRKWRLQLSVGKTVSAAYHLNNREAKRELDVFVDNKRLVCQQAPKYLGVRLDRMLNFKQHLEEVAGKVTSRVALIRRLAGTTWGASAKTLRISTQALVFPAAEYCAPVWSRSPHVKKVDVAINSSADHIWLSQADACVPAPCLSRDSPCRPKAESSHPCLGTEGSEIRLAHPARHDKERSAPMHTQVP